MGNLEKNIAINAENRADFARIANWIAPNAKVLDLGCGDGSLLTQLRKTHNIRGYGVEKDDANWKDSPALASFKPNSSCALMLCTELGLMSSK